MEHTHRQQQKVKRQVPFNGFSLHVLCAKAVHTPCSKSPATVVACVRRFSLSLSAIRFEGDPHSFFLCLFQKANMLLFSASHGKGQIPAAQEVEKGCHIKQKFQAAGREEFEKDQELSKAFRKPCCVCPVFFVFLFCLTDGVILCILLGYILICQSRYLP